MCTVSDASLRVGLISDVHANAVALEAVLADMPPVDGLVHAGDVVGYGPSPNACIDRLRSEDAVSIQGNHDEAVLMGSPYESGDEYAARVLTDLHRRWLAAQPDRRRLYDDRIRVAHGHPHERFRYTYPANFTADLLDGESVLVLGHTHEQAKRTVEDGVVVNPGSVGQPRDGDERAAYATVEFPGPTVQLHRVAYDIDRVAERIARTDISRRNATRLTSGR